MIKLAILLGAYLAFAVSNLGAISVNQSEWTNYKLQYGKVYEGPVDVLRNAIYERNKQLVDQFNKDRPEASSFRLKLNHLADYSKSELAHINGFKQKKRVGDAPPNSPEEQAFLDAILADTSIEVPDALDWRKTPGRVSEVKDQGDCGSCWTFAATGVLEGQETVRSSKRRPASSFKHFMSKGYNHKINVSLTLLSEENLIDCVKEEFNCEGGHAHTALRYIKTAGGIEDEASYPYEARYGECRFDQTKVAFRDNGAAILPVGDEQKLKEVVAKFGPVAVSVYATDLFLDYKGGVFFDLECPSDHSNHGVLIVGYGTDPKDGEYWIVKNSWRKDWGEDGYIRMARNRKNMCGIATRAVIPTF